MKNALIFVLSALIGIFSVTVNAKPKAKTPQPATMSFCFHWGAVEQMFADGIIKGDIVNLSKENPVIIDDTVPACRIAFGRHFTSIIESADDLKKLTYESFNPVSTVIRKDPKFKVNSFVEIKEKQSPIVIGGNDRKGYFCQKISEEGSVAFFEKLVPLMKDFFKVIAYKHQKQMESGTQPTDLSIEPTEPLAKDLNIKLANDNHLLFSCDDHQSYANLLNILLQASNKTN